MNIRDLNSSESIAKIMSDLFQAYAEEIHLRRLRMIYMILFFLQFHAFNVVIVEKINGYHIKEESLLKMTLANK